MKSQYAYIQRSLPGQQKSNSSLHQHSPQVSEIFSMKEFLKKVLSDREYYLQIPTSLPAYLYLPTKLVKHD